MKMTIVVPDKNVGIDGLFYAPVSLIGVPAEVRALQWENDAGHIEFFDSRPNEIINVLPDWCADVQQNWEDIDAQNATVEPSVDETNKTEAAMRLIASDWSALSDVSDPTKSNPYLGNASEFVEYRNFLRSVYLNPPNEKITFPEVPSANWVYL